MSARLRILLLAFFAFLVIARAVAAARLGLFGDEAFYFQCARRMAIAYSDHPFMTASLVRVGIDLFGPTTFGTRFVFQLIGVVFPFLIYALSRPHVGRRDAVLAAGVSLVIPATAWFGVIAIPDAPLMLFALLALLGFDRASRAHGSSALGWYALSGVCTALGLATHLRFVLVPFAFFVWLVLTRLGREQWRRLGLWVYALLATPGFLPVVLFNIQLDWQPIEFQGKDRHAGASFEGFLKHVPLQLGAVTPLLYIALLAVLVGLLKRSRRATTAELSPALLATFALVQLGIFFVTSPIADTEHATIHWPAPGYLPLLPFLPQFLRSFAEGAPWRRRLALATPASGAILLLVTYLELSFHPFELEFLKKPFTGYEVAARHVAAAIEAEPTRFGSPPLVVADHYILAGNLEQRLLERGIAIDLFVLDHEKNHEHGRALQFQIWGMDEPGLRTRSGRTALVIAEKNQSRSGNKKPQSWANWEPHIAGFFREFSARDRVVVESGGKDPRDFRLYVGADVLPSR